MPFFNSKTSNSSNGSQNSRLKSAASATGIYNERLRGKAEPGMSGSGIIHPTEEILPLDLGITWSAKHEFSSPPPCLIAATPDIPNTHPSLVIPGLAVFGIPSAPQSDEFHREITEKHFFFFISLRILETQIYPGWKNPPRPSNPNIPQAHHHPKCHIHTQMSIKHFIPSPSFCL